MGWVSAVPDKSAELPNLDKFLDLILQSLTLLGRVPAVLMVPTLLPSAIRGVYLENRIGRSRLSLRRSFL